MGELFRKEPLDQRLHFRNIDLAAFLQRSIGCIQRFLVAAAMVDNQVGKRGRAREQRSELAEENIERKNAGGSAVAIGEGMDPI